MIVLGSRIKQKNLSKFLLKQNPTWKMPCMKKEALFSGKMNRILNAAVGSYRQTFPAIATVLIQKKLKFPNDTHLVIQ